MKKKPNNLLFIVLILIPPLMLAVYAFLPQDTPIPAQAEVQAEQPVVKPRPLYPELSATVIAELVNQERSRAGLSRLTTNAQLEASACAKADDMMAKDYWAHIAPDGTEPWFFFDQAGYRYVSAGENLSFGYRSDGAIVSSWMGSETHRANILGAHYTEQGMCVRNGEFRGSNVALIVNHFGTPR